MYMIQKKFFTWNTMRRIIHYHFFEVNKTSTVFFGNFSHNVRYWGECA